MIDIEGKKRRAVEAKRKVIVVKRLTFASDTDSVNEREIRNRQVAYEAALEGIVLLKNDGALPIRQGKIALYGSGVTKTVKGGTGSGEVNERHSVTILEGIENAGFEISTRAWLSDYDKAYADAQASFNNKSILNIRNFIDDNSKHFLPPIGRPITEADVAASGTDTAIYVISRQAGEGADKKIERGDYDLFSEEIAHLKYLASAYKKTVLVINSGSSMNLSVLDDTDISAVIFFCQQGMEGGHAFADLISGKTSPSGKLTDTWAKSYSDYPFGNIYSYLSGDTSCEDYKEGIFVGYRYFDTFKVEPRFRFGFGLSYTSFESLPPSVSLNRSRVSINLTLKNIGNYPGREVMQVYVSAPNGKLLKEYQRLVSFVKSSELAPGTSEDLSLSFDMKDCASYQESDSSYVLEPGEYVVRLGNSSVNTLPVAVISVPKYIKVSQNRRICPPMNQVTELVPMERKKQDDLSHVAKLTLDPDVIITDIVTYEEPEVHSDPETDKILSRLNTDDLVEVCVGGGIRGMYATEHFFTPGAIGRTTDRLYEKGLMNVNLSDGPAGLRLLRVSAINRKGTQKLVKGNFMVSTMESLPDWFFAHMLAKPGDKRLYQFTTAFPVGTALAQSWNADLCERVGRAISDEMTEYGITYWLGPAMNIHRNPLCGRNFEYYSEDPVLTGRIAAAITRGVQSVQGNYATIKHLCCNNQEDNRNHSNSRVDERPLREIYLKGFEIAVREAGAKAVMTSYNLLNGTYTADSYDLCTSVVRNEWGFDGVVMSDWFSTGKGAGKNDLAIAAGNDLIMPGGGSYRREIKKGLRKGTLTEVQLRRAAANIIRSIVHSNVAKRVKKELFV